MADTGEPHHVIRREMATVMEAECGIARDRVRFEKALDKIRGLRARYGGVALQDKGD